MQILNKRGPKIDTVGTAERNVSDELKDFCPLYSFGR